MEEVYMCYFYDQDCNLSGGEIGVFKQEKDCVKKAFEFFLSFDMRQFLKTPIPLTLQAPDNIQDFRNIMSEYGNKNHGGSPGWNIVIKKVYLV